MPTVSVILFFGIITPSTAFTPPGSIHISMAVPLFPHKPQPEFSSSRESLLPISKPRPALKVQGIIFATESRHSG